MQVNQNGISQNSLDILELQAEASLEGGQSAYMVRDIFTDSDGYLDTVDEGETDASFQENYRNLNTTGNTEDGATDGSGVSSTYSSTITATAHTKGIMTRVSVYKTLSGTESARVNIVQGGKILATKTRSCNQTTTSNFDFTLEDYNDLIQEGTFEIAFTSLGAGQHTYFIANSNLSFSGTYFSFSNQKPHMEQTTNSGRSLIFAEVEIGDLKVQTNQLDLDYAPTHFQVFAWKPETEGTGSITADVSFDNGVNYTTANLDEPTEIPSGEQGTELIGRINLNAGASEGLASCKGYGVLFW
jgi:hypothetical protein